jgi:hypothetical protein
VQSSLLTPLAKAKLLSDKGLKENTYLQPVCAGLQRKTCQIQVHRTYRLTVSLMIKYVDVDLNFYSL